MNDLNWTKGINPQTGKPVEYNPKLDVQLYNPEARALRGDGTKRTCPTWHGGVAHQPLAYNPVKHIAMRRRHGRMLFAEWRGGRRVVERRRREQQVERAAHSSAAICTTAR